MTIYLRLCKINAGFLYEMLLIFCFSEQNRNENQKPLHVLVYILVSVFFGVIAGAGDSIKVLKVFSFSL